MRAISPTVFSAPGQAPQLQEKDMRVSSSSAAAVLQATLGADASTAVSAATMQRCLRFDQGGTLLGCDSKHASTATGALCGWAHEGGAPCRV